MENMAASTDGAPDKRLKALIVGPDIQGISGEPTHIRTLLSSPLAEEFHLSYYRVGGGERRVKPENPILRNLIRVFAPGGFVLKVASTDPDIVHINNSFNFKGLLRDCSMALAAVSMGKKVVFEGKMLCMPVSIRHL